MAVVELTFISKLLTSLGQAQMAATASGLANEVDVAINKYGRTVREPFGEVYAYEGR